MSEIKIEAEFDKSLIRERGQSVRYLCLEITAAPIDPKAQKRPPLNVALVVDASGSMGGQPLQAAKNAAKGVIDGMQKGDFLSVVSFAEDVIVHVPPSKLGANRQEAKDAVHGMTCRGLTDLSGGWLKGAECVAQVMEHNTGYHNHVILLSDGHANKGITLPDVLERHADQLRQRHVFTSTVGIGNGYSSTQMEALAEFGGGRMHDAEIPQEIIEVVLGELSEMSQCVIENLELTVVCQPGIKIQNVSRFPTTITENVRCTSLGALGPGQVKTTILRVTCPGGTVGGALDFAASASATIAGAGNRIVTGPVSPSLIFAPEHKNSTQGRNIRIAQKVARIWQASVVRRAVEINRGENFRELQKYLDHEIMYIARYCEGLPDTRRYIDELVRLRDISDHEWDERSRKDIQTSTYQSIHGYKDFRTTARQHWSSKLADE